LTIDSFGSGESGFIPFNRPALVGTELDYIRAAVGTMHVSGDGEFTKRCSRVLEQLLDVPRVMLTTSCTHALELAALLLDLESGDEVIMPSFTFVSTANAFALRGARPVFADIRSDTLNLDESQLERLVTPKTRAVVVVHYAGVGCEMDAIADVARRRGLMLIEDNAHGLFGSYKGKPLGTFGHLAALSFHETKNVTCGEGGALIVNDPAYLERAEIVREKGTDRTRFFQGLVDKYTWVDLGSSYLPSDILAAFLFAQLEARSRIQASRQYVWERYYRGLLQWSEQNGVQLPTMPEHCQHPFHMFHLLLPTAEMRDVLLLHLKEVNVQAVCHYLPLHLSKMGVQFGGNLGDCPVTETVSQRLVRLPFYNDLSDDDLNRVLAAVTAVSC
jgi:dTDP-4-amino-4,6-dideoxygalactose transaminase